MDVVANIAFVVEKGYFGSQQLRKLSSKIISLSRENLGTVDHTAPVYRIMTSIIDFDTYSRLSLLRFLLLKTATSGD